MAVLAVVIDGKWTPLGDDGQPLVRQSADTQVIEASMGGVEEIAGLLGQVVRLAQGLGPEDARRARDFMHAAQAAMTATTYLSGPDQQTFERSLRGGH
jgi:hypothetical protein